MTAMSKLLLATLLLAPLAVDADEVESAQQLPAELRAFVAPGTQPIWFSKADLDKDGNDDYLLVLQKERKPGADDYEMEEAQRPLLVLLNGEDGKLREAARNERVVLCSNCGGVMGDPFVGIEAGAGSFTVMHYGGSSWRWSTNVKFAYSRKDRAWQLVRVEESSFHASDPDKEKVEVATPPRDFGKIDFKDFDPAKWKGVGPR
jgi:hypothetical protein